MYLIDAKYYVTHIDSEGFVTLRNVKTGETLTRRSRLVVDFNDCSAKLEFVDDEANKEHPDER